MNAHNSITKWLKCLVGISIILCSAEIQAQKIYYSNFLVPDFSHSSGGSGFTLAGASVGAGSHSPRSTDGTIVLAHSTVGFIAATAEGYPGSFNVTTEDADSLANNSVRYRFLTNPDGSLQSPLTEKSNEIFTIGGITGQNAYNEASLIPALDQYRLAVRLNPLKPNGYQGVARITQEMMMARLVMGYAKYLESAKFRSLPPAVASALPGGIGSAGANERAALVQGLNHLEVALEHFATLARDPVEGIYLQPQAPFGLFIGTEAQPLTPLADEVSRLFETYVRVLALATEIDEKLQRLDYLANYKDPLSDVGPAKTGPGSPQAIAERIDFYGDYLTLLSAFTHCESFSYSPISRVRSGISSLSTLRDDVFLARLSFAPSVRQGNSESNFVQTSFVPTYVPFLTAGVQGSSSSRTFENLYHILTGGGSGSNIAGTLGAALAAELEAVSAAEQVIQTEDQLKERTTSTLIQYNGSLIELCGSFVNSDGKLLPDLQGYLFPLDIRQGVTGRAPSGAVAAQYKRIEIAQTRYEAAVADFTGLRQRIEITEQGAAARAGIARQTGQGLARIYTTYGEEFALLDKAAADIQAQAERDAARAQADAHKRGFWSKLGSHVKNAAILTAGIVAAPATGGASAALAITAVVAASASAAVNEIENWTDTNKQGKAIMKSADIKARSIAALGEISQQQTRLRAAESAEVAMISADGQARQIEETAKEEIRKIYVEMERSKLNILLAEQEIDLAELELVNLFDRVGYLLEEYQEAIRMLAELPLNRPDFRYVRDYKIQFAEDQFRAAQMWTYLTLKSAQYRFMTSNTFDQVGDLIERTLKCRNATEILNHVINPASGGLATLGANFYLSNDFQATVLTPVMISLRDQIFQTNVVSRSADGERVTGVPAFFMPLAASYGPVPETASDTQWLEILNKAITGSSSGKPVLKLRFATSFDPRGTNPLHNSLSGQLGHVILSSGGDGNRKGVFVNLRGANIPAGNYVARLDQVGTTYLTYRARSWPAHQSAWSGTNLPVRTWSLPQRGASFTMLLNRNLATVFSEPDSIVPKQSDFDERSPFCDQWELVIDGSTIFSPNWFLLTFDLAKIKDFTLGMTVVGFNPQVTTP